ncbi:hypothetical protein AYO37_01290 [Opitutia bacterium SCGC AG-212-L18]|nr:hypothetical protein AYO37_01290 [Opitutae bacterium SCGC AG-212-L18]
MKYKSILMDQFLSIFEVAPGVRRENSQKLGLKRVCNSLFLLIPNSGFHQKKERHHMGTFLIKRSL